MGWIRANLRFGSWCALFALAIQLVVSFGHVHGIGAPSPWQVSASGQADPVGLNAPSGPSKPAVPAVDYCAICAVISLAGSIVPPAVPAIPLPARDSHLLVWTSAEPFLAAASYRPWQARAPPQA
jgi:hypothetical protein